MKVQTGRDGAWIGAHFSCLAKIVHGVVRVARNASDLVSVGSSSGMGIK